MGLDCRADTMARSDEKFLRIRHSCRGRKNVGIWLPHVTSPGIYFPSSSSPANLSDVDPALDDSRPDVRPELPVLEHGADHAGSHGVELRDGGADGGGAVLVVLLVPLGPYGAQAVVRHHLLEQQLRRKRAKKKINKETS